MRPVHVIAASSLAEMAAGLAVLGAGDDDLVLTHPADHALVAGGPAEIAAAHDVFGDAVCVAAGAAPPPGTTAVPELLEALTAATGTLPYRAHPHPLGLCGPAGALAKLLADCGTGPAGDDTGRLARVLLSGAHEVAIDVAGQVFRVLDTSGPASPGLDTSGPASPGLDDSGSDVVVVAGRFHAGGERPVVAIDPSGGPGLAALADALADPGARDLAAILRYDGAEAPDGAMAVVAPEILVVPFWTREFCASVIRAAEAAGVWSSDPEDPVPGSEVSLFAISPRLVGLLEEDLARRVWPRLRSHWGEVAVTAIHDAFVLRYEPGGPADGLDLHHDIAQVSASVRLNDGYRGGALSFPRQGWDAAAVPVGQLVAWPSLVTHPHRAEPVTRGVKYGLTIWFGLPTG